MSEEKKPRALPALRFPEFQGEVPFEPGGALFQPVSTRSPRSGLPVLAVTQDHGAIPRERIDYRVFVSEKSLESYKVVERGDFIISLRSFQGGIEYSEYRGLCSPAYTVLRRKAALSEPYYRHYFKTGRLIRELNRNLEGLRDGKMVSYRQFSQLWLPRPRREEQEKVAACLSSLDALAALEEEKLLALQRYKRALMDRLFPAPGETVPSWRFPEFRDSGDWVPGAIRDTCESFSGGTPDTHKKAYYKGNIPFIRSGEIGKEETELFLTEAGFQNSSAKLVSRGDVLVALYGANSGEVALSRIDGAINQAILCLRHESCNAFVYHYLSHLKSRIVKTYIQGGQGNLSGEIVKSIRLCFPPRREEQEKVAGCLSSVDRLLSAQREKLERLKAHKRGLAQGLFPAAGEAGE